MSARTGDHRMSTRTTKQTPAPPAGEPQPPPLATFARGSGQEVRIGIGSFKE